MKDDLPNDQTRTCLLNNKSENKDEDKTPDESQCPWWINSPDHGYCFWAYIKDKSGPDGSMPELVQSEIAHLCGWSNTKTHFMLKQAEAELIALLKKANANQLISDDSEPVLDIHSFNINPVSNYDSEDPEE